MELAHKYIVANEVRLHYVQAGKGKKLVVLLHGWPEFWYTWRKQIPALADHFTVVAPDLRGFNESDKPKGVANYHANIVAKDIAELIRNLGFDKAHVVGHDWGGAIAYNIAIQHPEVVDKLVIMNAPHPAIFVKALTSNFKQLMRSYYMFLFQIPWLPEKLIGRDLTTFFNKAFLGWCYNKDAFSPEDIQAFVKAYSIPGALESSINYYRAGIRLGPREVSRGTLNKKIEAQTLVIWGEGDKALGKELTYNMDKYFSNGYEVNYIPNCSHWVQNDCPDEVNTHMLAFLTQH
jgi:epoxide hydrolase 4